MNDVIVKVGDFKYIDTRSGREYIDVIYAGEDNYFIVKLYHNRNSYNVIDVNGEVVFSNNYDYISYAGNDLFYVGRYVRGKLFKICVNKSGAFLSINQTMLSEFYQSYDFVYCVKDECYFLMRGDKYGLAVSEKVILDCEYDYLGDLLNLYFICKKDGCVYLAGLTEGNIIEVPNDTYEVKYYSDKCVVLSHEVNNNRHYSSIIDLTGLIIFPKSNIIIQEFDNGHALFYRDDMKTRFGVISETGNIILDSRYSKIEFYDDSIIADGQRYSYCGKMVMRHERDLIELDTRYDACGDFYDGLARVRKIRKSHEPTHVYRVRDRRRKPILADEFGNLDKRYLASETEYEKLNRRWGFINIKGEEVIACQFCAVGDFSEGLAMACYTTNYKGYIGLSGNFVIPRKYSCCSRFSEDRAFVGNNGMCMIAGEFMNYSIIIDRDGNEVCKFSDISNIYSIYPSYIYDYCDGLARFRYQPQDLFGTKKYGFIDKSGRVVIDNLKYAEDFKDGYADVTIGDDIYPMDKEGSIFISDDKYSVRVSYSIISNFDKIVFVNSCILANYGSLWGNYGYKDIVSQNGDIISVSPYGIYETVEISRDGECLLVKAFGSEEAHRLSFNGYFLIGSSVEPKEMQHKYFWYRQIDCEGVFYIVDSLHNTQGIVDNYGKEVIPCIYEKVDVDRGRRHIRCKNIEKYIHPDFFYEGNMFDVFYDFSFNQIIPNVSGNDVILKGRYDATREFSENGLAAVCKSDRWGFVDRTGELVIPCCYVQVDDFKGDLCRVESPLDGWITIDAAGEQL